MQNFFYHQKKNSATKKPAWASRPSSANSTARSENPEPHNIFRPVSALSTDDEWSHENTRKGDAGDTLTQSINKLHSLQNRLSDVIQPGAAAKADEKASFPNTSRSAATEEYQSDATPLASVRSQSIDDFIQDIMERTPRNIGEIDLAAGDALPRSSKPEAGPEMSTLANNVFRPSHKPKAKASLSSMENSYHNIKTKTPVNQVKKSAPSISRLKGNNKEGIKSKRHLQQNKVNTSSKDFVTKNTVEEYMDVLTTAAVKIQKWYRRHRTRRIAAEAAVKRLLDQKKEVLICLA